MAKSWRREDQTTYAYRGADGVPEVARCAGDNFYGDSKISRRVAHLREIRNVVAKYGYRLQAREGCVRFPTTPKLAERNVEQARTAYGQLMDAMAQATGMWISAMPSNEMTSGFKVVRERAIQFAKQNAEACFAAASELANAKDIQDLLAIQSRSAQTQMQAYALQAQELGRLMVEAAQSVQPRS